MPEWHAEQALKKYWDGKLPVRLGPMLSGFDIDYYFVDLDCPGCIVVGGGRCIMLIDRDLPARARRFRAAHELGHWIMHRSTICGGCQLGVAEEYEASEFAAALLVPRGVVVRWLWLYKAGLERQRDLAAACAVGVQVADIRMEDFIF